jgi:multidrug resistance efflux pump
LARRHVSKAKSSASLPPPLTATCTPPTCDPGDTVKAGQLLVELAQQDLQVENRKWEAELNQHQNSAAGALARGDRTQYALAQARASETAAQLELAREQLARTQLIAPIDGLVSRATSRNRSARRCSAARCC